MSHAQYRAVQRSYTIMTPYGSRRVRPECDHHCECPTPGLFQDGGGGGGGGDGGEGGGDEGGGGDGGSVRILFPTTTTVVNVVGLGCSRKVVVVTVVVIRGFSFGQHHCKCRRPRLL